MGNSNIFRELTLSNCSQYLLACAYGNHRVQVFNAMTGTFVKSYGTNGSGNGQSNGPRRISISPSGQIIISEADIHDKQHRVQIPE